MQKQSIPFQTIMQSYTNKFCFLFLFVFRLDKKCVYINSCAFKITLLSQIMIYWKQMVGTFQVINILHQLKNSIEI